MLQVLPQGMERQRRGGIRVSGSFLFISCFFSVCRVLSESCTGMEEKRCKLVNRLAVFSVSSSSRFNLGAINHGNGEKARI